MDEMLKNLHRDLARKFKRHGPRIEQTWRSLSQKERENMLRDASADRAVLKDPYDRSLGNVWKFIPEWNLRDLTPASSDILLDILKYRATAPLPQQYTEGVNGAPGDHQHIKVAMQKYGLQLADTSSFKDCYTLFLDDEKYGQSFKITPGHTQEFLQSMKPAIEAQLLIPQVMGELVLMRQQCILQHLNIIFDDIFDAAPAASSKKTRPNKPADAATAALATLSLHSPSRKLGIPDLVNNSREQKANWVDYVYLMSTEPTVLSRQVNFWFFTRPELVGDEMGRYMPAHTDSYISGAVLDALHGAVQATANWSYIAKLLALLENPPDKQFRAMVLQELSNACYLELVRAQALFKRSVSAFLGGSKWFERKSTVRKDGLVRVSMKRRPDSLMIENPQLCYMLQLCQENLDWSSSIQWLQKLEDLHRAHPMEKDKMDEFEFSSLGDLAIIVTFLQSLSQIQKLPASSKKQKHSFIVRVSDLETRIRQCKEGLDLDDFAVPMGNLLEPGMADSALASLDRHIHDKMGTKLGVLYEELVDDSIASLLKRYHESKAKASEAEAEYVVPAIPEVSASSCQPHKEKEKTRPAHSSAYDSVSETASSTSPSAQPAPPHPKIKVRPNTFAVFSSLLSRSSAARGPINWDSFVAAMTDIGFAVLPKVGSICTFVPPENMVVQRDCTLHRPHSSRIEGVLLLVYSRRLKRVYQWDESTFVPA